MGSKIVTFARFAARRITFAAWAPADAESRDEFRACVIVRRGGKFCLLTRDRSRTLGCHATHREAAAQEAAIEISKAKARHGAYNPDQKRAPKGSSTGGQWVDDPGSLGGQLGSHEGFPFADKTWGGTTELESDPATIATNAAFRKINSENNSDYLRLDNDARYDISTQYPRDLMVVASVDLDLLASGYSNDYRVREMSKDIKAGKAKFPPLTLELRGNGTLNILDGQTRVAAFRELGIRGRVPAVIRLYDYGAESLLPAGVRVDEARTRSLRTSARALAGWDESKHPRVPAGDANGGEFAGVEFPFADDAEFQDTLALNPIEHRITDQQYDQIHDLDKLDDPDERGNQDAKLKKQLSTKLGFVLDDEFDSDKLNALAAIISTHSEGSSGYAVSTAFVDGWAMSSGDTNAMSILYQHAANEAAGADGVFEHMDLVNAGPFNAPFEAKGDSAFDRVLNAVDQELGLSSGESHGLTANDVYDMMRVHARAQYENTQKELSKRGITSVALFRGVSIEPKDADAVARTGLVALQPLSSFSSSRDIALDFAGSSGNGDPVDLDPDGPTRVLTHGHVLRATFPASRVFSVPRTGFGCLAENEWVILGTRSTKVRISKRYGKFNKPKITPFTPTYKPIPDEIDEPTFVPFQGREAWDESEHPRDDDGKFTDVSAADLDEAAQIAAVEYYTNGDFDINATLRAGKDLTGDLKQTADALDAVIAKGNTRSYSNMVLHRGIPAEFAPKFKVGSSFVDHGFVSTSMSKSYARDFVEDSFGKDSGVYLQIEMPGGHSLFSVNGMLGDDHSSAYQSEVILPRRSIFKVISKKGDTIRVRLLQKDEK